MYNFGKINPQRLKLLVRKRKIKEITDTAELTTNGYLSTGRLILVYKDKTGWYACVPYNYKEVNNLINHLATSNCILEHQWHHDEKRIQDCTL